MKASSIDSLLLELVDAPPPPEGWEKCLDLKSGLVYFRNRASGVKSFTNPSPRSPLQSLEYNQSASAVAEMKSQLITSCSGVDLELGLGRGKNCKYRNAKASTAAGRLKQEEFAEDLDLRLRLPGVAPDDSDLSTIALETQRSKQAVPPPSSSPSHASKSSSSSSPSSSTTIELFEGVCEAESRRSKRLRTRTTSQECPVMVIVGCRHCLMYVMISKDNPSCPKCGNKVPLDFIPNKASSAAGSIPTSSASHGKQSFR